MNLKEVASLVVSLVVCLVISYPIGCAGGYLLRVIHNLQGIDMDHSWRAWTELYLLMGLSMLVALKIINVIDPDDPGVGTSSGTASGDGCGSGVDTTPRESTGTRLGQLPHPGRTISTSANLTKSESVVRVTERHLD